MRRTFHRGAPAVTAIICLSLLGAACNTGGSDTTTGGSSPSGETAMDYSTLKGTLQGSGASFQGPFNDAAREALMELAPDLTVNYNPVGSGAGKTDLIEQKTQWAGSDSLLKDDEKAKAKGGTILYFPTVSAPVTVSYNVSGIAKLQLSPSTIAKIFQGEVTRWDDAAVKEDNPGASLPGADIKVVRRADSSGTTENFTKYLKKAAADTWKLEAASTVTWPEPFIAGQQNGGVAQAIKSTEGSIGYVDFSDAKTAGLKLAAVKNKKGTYVEPSLAATSAALSGAKVNADLTYDALDADAADAYPIAASTYILVYQKYPDAEVVAGLKGWLTFVLNEGQALAEGVNYAKLPDSLRTKALDQVANITAG